MKWTEQEGLTHGTLSLPPMLAYVRLGFAAQLRFAWRIIGPLAQHSAVDKELKRSDRVGISGEQEFSADSKALFPVKLNSEHATGAGTERRGGAADQRLRSYGSLVSGRSVCCYCLEGDDQGEGCGLISGRSSGSCCGGGRRCHHGDLLRPGGCLQDA
jgi:hypothetical protein